ncbi:MAG: aldehyde dehydrogenase family protein, partial [Mycobacterium sp.]
MTTTDTAVSRPGALERTQWGAFVDGGFVPVDDQETFEVVEPSTARPLARVVSADAALVDRAVQSARRALPAWPGEWKCRISSEQA